MRPMPTTTSQPAAAHLVSSRIATGPHTGKHTPMVDLDIPTALLPSSTPGHHHLYLDLPMTWRAYRRLLKALWKAGAIEKSYYTAAKRDRATHLRPPWAKKQPAPTNRI